MHLFFSFKEQKAALRHGGAGRTDLLSLSLGFETELDLLVAALRDLSPGKWKNDAES